MQRRIGMVGNNQTQQFAGCRPISCGRSGTKRVRCLKTKTMMNTRRGSKQQDRSQSQVSGPGKDAFIRRALADIPGLDDELAGQVAEHLSRLIDIIKTDKAIIERYKARK